MQKEVTMDQVVLNTYGLILKENPNDRNEVVIDRLYTDYDKCFAIDFVKLKWCGFDEKKNFPMFRLMLIVNGEEAHVQRYGMAMYKWKELLDATEKIKKTHKQGYYCHLGLGTPLQEFEKGDVEDFTYISQRTPTIWFFLGNHKTYSGVFHYFIWKPELVEVIKEKLPASKIHPL